MRPKPTTLTLTLALFGVLLCPAVADTPPEMIHDTPDPVSQCALASLLGVPVPVCEYLLGSICAQDDPSSCCIYHWEECPSPCDDGGIDASGCSYKIADDRGRVAREVAVR